MSDRMSNEDMVKEAVEEAKAKAAKETQENGASGENAESGDAKEPEMNTADAQDTESAEAEDAQSEAEKRRIFSFAGTNFSQFVDSTYQMDERSYRNLIDIASSELKRLSTSERTLRSMLSASESQTTEDALAQILINV